MCPVHPFDRIGEVQNVRFSNYSDVKKPSEGNPCPWNNLINLLGPCFTIFMPQAEKPSDSI